jgi:hypothetical protein
MKYTKEQAQYEPKAMGEDHCRDCVFYTSGSCTKVEGSISPAAWCQFYQEKAGKMHTEGHSTLKGMQTSEHDTVTSRVTGRKHEIKFGPQPSGLVPKNPFASQAQAGYLHSHPEILGKEKLAEFDSATKGKKLPKRVK